MLIHRAILEGSRKPGVFNSASTIFASSAAMQTLADFTLQQKLNPRVAQADKEPNGAG